MIKLTIAMLFILSISQTLHAESLTQIEAADFCNAYLDKSISTNVENENPPELKRIKNKCFAQAKKYKFQRELSASCEEIYTYSAKINLRALENVVNCREVIGNAEVSANSIKFCAKKFDAKNLSYGVRMQDKTFTDHIACLKGISFDQKISTAHDFSQCLRNKDTITCDGKKYVYKAEAATPCAAVNASSIEVEKKTEALVAPVNAVTK